MAINNWFRATDTFTVPAGGRIRWSVKFLTDETATDIEDGSTLSWGEYENGVESNLTAVPADLTFTTSHLAANSNFFPTTTNWRITVWDDTKELKSVDTHVNLDTQPGLSQQTIDLDDLPGPVGGGTEPSPVPHLLVDHDDVDVTDKGPNKALVVDALGQNHVYEDLAGGAPHALGSHTNVDVAVDSAPAGKVLGTTGLGQWDAVDPPATGIPEAPEDGNAYGRKDALWTQVAEPGDPQPPTAHTHTESEITDLDHTDATARAAAATADGKAEAAQSTADAHIANPTGAHPASAVAVTPGNPVTAIDAEAAISELHGDAAAAQADATQALADAAAASQPGHTHTESEVTDLDKYDQATVDAKDTSVAANASAELAAHHLPTSADHDDRYYTEAEIDAQMAGKADQSAFTAHTGDNNIHYGDALADGKQYARRNNAWEEVVVSGGGGTYQGEYDAAANSPNYPNGAGLVAGDYFIISDAGTLGTVSFNAGDRLEAAVDTPTNTDADWLRIPAVSDHQALTNRTATDAHPATSVSYDNAVSGLAATEVKSALDEIDADMDAVETGAAHDATARAAAAAAQTTADDHIVDPLDAHDASAISVTPANPVTATDVEAAVSELHGLATGSSQPGHTHVEADITDLGADAQARVDTHAAATDHPDVAGTYENTPQLRNAAGDDLKSTDRVVVDDNGVFVANPSWTGDPNDVNAYGAGIGYDPGTGDMGVGVGGQVGALRSDVGWALQAPGFADHNLDQGVTVNADKDGNLYAVANPEPAWEQLESDTADHIATTDTVIIPTFTTTNPDTILPLGGDFIFHCLIELTSTSPGGTLVTIDVIEDPAGTPVRTTLFSETVEADTPVTIAQPFGQSLDPATSLQIVATANTNGGRVTTIKGTVDPTTLYIAERGASGGTPDLPTTTKGDLIVHNGTTDVRLPVGADDSVLVADSADPEGVAYKSTLSNLTLDGTNDISALRGTFQTQTGGSDVADTSEWGDTFRFTDAYAGVQTLWLMGTAWETNPPAGWYCHVISDGQNWVDIHPSEPATLIDGADRQMLPKGHAATVWFDGTEFHTSVAPSHHVSSGVRRTATAAQNTAALQAAIDSLQGYGGTVELPHYSFEIDGRITVHGGVNLVGQGGGYASGQGGTRINCTTATAGLTFSGPGGMSGRFVVNGQDIATEPFLDGETAVENTAKRTYLDVSVWNSAGVGVRLDGAQNNHYVNLFVNHCVTNGIQFEQGAAGNLFSNAQVGNCDEWAVIADETVAGSFSEIRDNSFYNGMFDFPATGFEGHVRLGTKCRLMSFRDCNFASGQLPGKSMVWLDSDFLGYAVFDGCNFFGGLVANLTAFIQDGTGTTTFVGHNSFYNCTGTYYEHNAGNVKIIGELEEIGATGTPWAGTGDPANRRQVAFQDELTGGNLPWFDVTDYGAVGDGVTDDTAAIQAAEDAASTAGTAGEHARVVFPLGHYAISANLVKKANTDWESFGARIRNINNGNGTGTAFALVTVNAVDGWTIDGLTFENVPHDTYDTGWTGFTSFGTWNTCFDIRDSDNWTIKNCRMEKLSAAVRLWENNHYTLDNNFVDAQTTVGDAALKAAMLDGTYETVAPWAFGTTGGFGVWFEGATQHYNGPGTITNNHLRCYGLDTAFNPAHTSYGESPTLIHGNVIEGARCGIQLYNNTTDPGTADTIATRVQMVDNNIRFTWEQGVYIRQVMGAVVSDNYFYQCGLAPTGLPTGTSVGTIVERVNVFGDTVGPPTSPLISDFEPNLITGNYIANPGRDGVAGYAVVHLRHPGTVFSDNTIVRNATYTPSATWDDDIAVWIDGGDLVEHVTVTDNHIANFSTGIVYNSKRVDVSVHPPLERNVRIAGNTVRDCSFAGIYSIYGYHGVIENNQIADSLTGIRVQYSPYSRVDSNRVTRCTNGVWLSNGNLASDVPWLSDPAGPTATNRRGGTLVVVDNTYLQVDTPYTVDATNGDDSFFHGRCAVWEDSMVNGAPFMAKDWGQKFPNGVDPGTFTARIWTEGDRVYNESFPGSGPEYMVCTTSGVYGDQTPTTVNTTAGSPTLSSIADISGWGPGLWVNVDGAGPYLIERIDVAANTITLDQNVGATAIGAALALAVPAFASPQSGGGGATNLDWLPATSEVTSDTGTNATLTVVDGTNPGLQSVADKAKQDRMVETGAAPGRRWVHDGTNWVAGDNTQARVGSNLTVADSWAPYFNNITTANALCVVPAGLTLERFNLYAQANFTLAGDVGVTFIGDNPTTVPTGSLIGVQRTAADTYIIVNPVADVVDTGVTYAPPPLGAGQDDSANLATALGSGGRVEILPGNYELHGAGADTQPVFVTLTESTQVFCHPGVTFQAIDGASGPVDSDMIRLRLGAADINFEWSGGRFDSRGGQLIDPVYPNPQIGTQSYPIDASYLSAGGTSECLRFDVLGVNEAAFVPSSKLTIRDTEFIISDHWDEYTTPGNNVGGGGAIFACWSDITIDNVYVKGSRESGIYLAGSVGGTGFSPGDRHRITNSTFVDCYTALSSKGGTVQVVFTDNHFTNCARTISWEEASQSSDPRHGLLINDNTFDGCGWLVHAWGDRAMTFTGNAVTEWGAKEADGTTDVGASFGVYAFVLSSSNCRISDNVFDGMRAGVVGGTLFWQLLMTDNWVNTYYPAGNVVEDNTFRDSFGQIGGEFSNVAGQALRNKWGHNTIIDSFGTNNFERQNGTLSVSVLDRPVLPSFVPSWQQFRGIPGQHGQGSRSTDSITAGRIHWCPMFVPHDVNTLTFDNIRVIGPQAFQAGDTTEIRIYRATQPYTGLTVEPTPIDSVSVTFTSDNQSSQQSMSGTYVPGLYWIVWSTNRTWVQNTFVSDIYDMMSVEGGGNAGWGVGCFYFYAASGSVDTPTPADTRGPNASLSAWGGFIYPLIANWTTT